MKKLALAALVVFSSSCAPPASESEQDTPPSDGGGPTTDDVVPPDEDPPTQDPPSDEPPPPLELTRVVLLVPGTTIDGSYFDVMAERLRADGYEPVVFVPPDLFTDSLATGAQRIAAAVDDTLSAVGESKLHIVAECNGGVATRYFLQVLGGDERVNRVVTFVSAHHGTWLSPVGDWTTGFPSLADITPGSPFLAELDAAPFPSGLDLTSIYSCNDELMLPYDTSVVAGATNVLFCDRPIGHFDGFWDPVVYERIRLTLDGDGDSAPTHY